MPTLTLINSMVVLLQGMGELQEARELYDEALQGRREMLGDRHLDTLTTWMSCRRREICWRKQCGEVGKRLAIATRTR